MTRILLLLSMLMLAAPLSAAPKDKDKDKDDKEKKDKKEATTADERRPSGREIAAEAVNARYDKSRAIDKKLKNGDLLRFTPAFIGQMKMRDFAPGAVVGFLDIDRKGEATGLPPGKYHVYVKQIRGDWDAFYEKDGQIVKDAVGVKFFEQGQRDPKWKDDAECILYSHWEFCY